MVSEFNIVAVLVARQYVGPDAEEDIITGRNHMQDVHACLITLTTTLGVLHVLGDLLGGQLSVNVHELEDSRANLVELLKLNSAEHLNVIIAPDLLFTIVHSLSLSKLILHGTNNVLSNLAHMDGVVNVSVRSLSPLRNERVQICLAVHIRERVACQCFRLFQKGQIHLSVFLGFVTYIKVDDTGSLGEDGALLHVNGSLTFFRLNTNNND